MVSGCLKLVDPIRKLADGLVLVLEGVLQGLDLEDVVGDFLKVDLDFIILLI